MVKFFFYQLIQNSRFDKLAERKLITYKKRNLGMAPYELMYFRRDLHHLKKNDLEIQLKNLEETFSKLSPGMEDKACYMLIKAVMLKGLNDEEQSVALLKVFKNIIFQVLVKPQKQPRN